MDEKFLIVKLDQYAGNVDEIVCTALTGFGSERYGESQARKVFDEKVLPLLDNANYWELPVTFMNFKTHYGLLPYELDSSSTNNLRLGIDSYTDANQLNEMIDIWKRAYKTSKGHLEIRVDGIHSRSVTVKVLGFELVTASEHRESPE